MRFDLSTIGIALMVWALCWMRVENTRSEQQVQLAKMHCQAVIK